MSSSCFLVKVRVVGGVRCFTGSHHSEAPCFDSSLGLIPIRWRSIGNLSSRFFSGSQKGEDWAQGQVGGEVGSLCCILHSPLSPFTNMVLSVNAVFVLTTCSLFPLTLPYSTFLRTVGTKVSKEILCIKTAVQTMVSCRPPVSSYLLRQGGGGMWSDGEGQGILA